MLEKLYTAEFQIHVFVNEKQQHYEKDKTLNTEHKERNDIKIIFFNFYFHWSPKPSG